jgi:hypothetical protein
MHKVPQQRMMRCWWRTRVQDRPQSSRPEALAEETRARARSRVAFLKHDIPVQEEWLLVLWVRHATLSASAESTKMTIQAIEREEYLTASNHAIGAAGALHDDAFAAGIRDPDRQDVLVS